MHAPSDLRKNIGLWGAVLAVVGGTLLAAGASLSHWVDPLNEPQTPGLWALWLLGVGVFFLGAMIGFGGVSAIGVLGLEKLQKWRAAKQPPATGGS
ncbi:MAG: hypothetical protein JNG84_05915 [Archangium sp.]|nr:hypothetical protein [Archangium sp.]